MFRKLHFLVACFMVASIVATPLLALADDCDDADAKGAAKADADYRSSGWFLGGIGSGLLLGPIGTAIITGMGAGSNPEPRRVPDQMKEECYVHGYTKKARSRNTTSALGGGLLGTGLLILLVAASGS